MARVQPFERNHYSVSRDVAVYVYLFYHSNSAQMTAHVLFNIHGPLVQGCLVRVDIEQKVCGHLIGIGGIK